MKKVMKTVKILATVFLLSLCFVSFSQSTKTSTQKSVYFVQTSHTPEQCLNTLTEIKSKGDAFLSKFEFGCMSGNHTGYAFLEGTSEENVRMMLPKDAQATADIKKVGKFTSAQIEQLHKDHPSK
jgi:hypothetical protein